MTSPTISFPGVGKLTGATYLLVLLAIATYANLESDESPLILAGLVVATAILLGRLRAKSNPAQKPLVAPKLIINIVVVLAACFFFFEVSSRSEQGGHFFVTALGHFIEVLLLCKVFDRRSDRDLMQIVVLTLLLVVASAMYSQTMFFAALLLAYFATLIYVILLGYLHFETQAAASSRAQLVLPGPEDGRCFRRDVRRSATLATCVLLPIALLVFLILPRNRAAGMSAGGGNAGVTFQTGFSSTVQFRDYGRLAQSDEIVMEVRLTQNGQSLGSSYFDPYFRGQTQDLYDPLKRRWISSHAPCESAYGTEMELQEGAADILPEEQTEGSGVIWQEYKMYVPEGELLFSIAPASRVLSSQLATIYWEPDDFTLSAHDRPTPLSYTVASASPYQPLNASMPNDAPAAPPPELTLNDRQLVQFGDPQSVPDGIGDFARNVIAPDLLTGPAKPITPEFTRAVVLRFETYLRTHYAYSLELAPVDPTLDPTLDFLKNRTIRGGHCELFASAMVMLCRSQGINARMVQGFHGAEYNSISERYTVRQLNAHTWAEVYIPGSGWTLSDPTPSSESQDDPNFIVRRWAREIVQLVENTWQLVVVSFDNDTRRSLVQWFVANIKHPITRFFTDIWAAVLYESRAPDFWGRITLFGPLIGLAFVIGWLARRWRTGRRAATFPRRAAKLTGDALFLDELLRLVARANPAVAHHGGIDARPVYQTPREFIEQFGQVLGDQWNDARWLVEAFYRMRFGSEPVTAAIRIKVSEAMTRVRQAAREGSH